MRFLTHGECGEWAAARGIPLGVGGLPERYPPLPGVVRFRLPPTPGQLTWLARFISACLEPRHECLLWIKEFGTFPTSENLHLYYRLRQSYGDLRLLREASGHLFLEHEEADFVSFLQVGILNGWEMHVFAELAYGSAHDARAIVAHDNEWIAVYHNDPATLMQWRAALTKAGYEFLAERGSS